MLFPPSRFAKPQDIVMILDSSGGDAGSAYKIAKLIRNRANNLTIVVPRWAKSAATLICLAADELIMTEIAELGPIDPQKRRPGELYMRPVLDEYVALDALNEESLNSLFMFLESFEERKGIDTKDLLPYACSYVSHLMSPVYSQVNPFIFGSHMRTMNISREYAQRLLKMSKNPPINIEEIAFQIVFRYPCHDFILDVEELKRLGLNARLTTSEEEKVIREIAKRSQKFNIIGTIDIERYSEVIEEAAPAKEIIKNEKGRRKQ